MILVKGQAIGLINRAFIPIEAEPGKAVQNRVDGFFGGPYLICVFDAEDEFPSLVAGHQPIKKGRAGSSYMQITRRAGGKAYNRFQGFLSQKKVFESCFILGHTVTIGQGTKSTGGPCYLN
jgi:hypothetical protein